MTHANLHQRLPAEAMINYLFVLSSLENYGMPTNPGLSVEEIIQRKIFAWYLHEQSIQHQEIGEIEWFMNYE